MKKYFFLIIFICLSIVSCKEKKKGAKVADLSRSAKKGVVSYEEIEVIGSVKRNWASEMLDLTGDQLVDLVFVDNTSKESNIAYYKANRTESWPIITVGKQIWTDSEGTFEEIQLVDMDDDHDTDIVVFVKTESKEQHKYTFLWYENLGEDEWKLHDSKIDYTQKLMGEFDFIDFDKDGKIDFSLLSSESNHLIVFKQVQSDVWQAAQEISDYELRPSVAVGNLNDDEYPDIVSSGVIFYNPVSDITKNWEVEKLDEKWKNSDADSDHIMQVVLQDVDHDKKAEIYMTHENKEGYPLIAFKNVAGSWAYRVIKENMPICKRLEIVDVDRNLNFDIITNQLIKGATQDKLTAKTVLMINDGSYITYNETTIDSLNYGILRASDYDMNGDIDFLRYAKEGVSNFSILRYTRK